MTASPFSSDLSRLSISEYLERLASDNPSPGGGSAGALCGSLAAGLVEMACGINAKRPKNPQANQSRLNAEQVRAVRRRFLELVTLDAQAYETLCDHWKKKSPELESAVQDACRIPLEIGSLALRTLEIAADELPRTSPHLLSDLREAAKILDSVQCSSTFHAEANLTAMKNGDFIAETRKRIDVLTRSIRSLASRFDSAQGDQA